ncbi:hypothetical protein D187_001739 [Cystobacter fuscus DSM 2262]|uniref:Uncharacterized protein n=1 Tax=Cystobacter fuscus (strain ATCC 25194 / DSM 2262 / NBRC 100088 / M29) TaxID=1242864 RepID=S9P835_CYSF2|nr:hypothetical protein D187_001739 [Cystobacter fuscus DSM 2262]
MLLAQGGQALVVASYLLDGNGATLTRPLHSSERMASLPFFVLKPRRTLAWSRPGSTRARMTSSPVP